MDGRCCPNTKGCKKATNDDNSKHHVAMKYHVEFRAPKTENGKVCTSMEIRIRTQWTDSRGSGGLHICRGMINTNDNLEDQTNNLKGKDYSMQTRDPSRNRKQIIRQNAYGSEMGTD